MTIHDKIENLARPIVERLGCKLWGCQCIVHHTQRLIRIYIDKSEGVQLSDCEQVSYAVSAALDVENLMVDQYRLEISSPGLPRPLFYLWQYQENIGKKVHLKLLRTVEGQRRLNGNILLVNNDLIVLESETGRYEVEISNVAKAHLES
jgi:ribosome maturation factor RimP